MDNFMVVSNSLLSSVVKHEGFEMYPYQDTLGITTIGHGLTWISEDESMLVVQLRLSAIQEELTESLNFFKTLPENVKECLTEMAYQMGTQGLLGFKDMLFSLSIAAWSVAATNGLDSKWARQTPERAKEMMQLIRETKR